ncbi:hypothetical protein Bbelb_169280 [Branchiostoma belcheri]|nr:hypothetical protein Bbelb_169280 [Branchiostoma belcheri]
MAGRMTGVGSGKESVPSIWYRTLKDNLDPPLKQIVVQVSDQGASITGLRPSEREKRVKMDDVPFFPTVKRSECRRESCQPPLKPERGYPPGTLLPRALYLYIYLYSTPITAPDTRGQIRQPAGTLWKTRWVIGHRLKGSEERGELSRERRGALMNPAPVPSAEIHRTSEDGPDKSPGVVPHRRALSCPPVISVIETEGWTGGAPRHPSPSVSGLTRPGTPGPAEGTTR